MDTVTFQFRVERSLREQFEKCCVGVDRTASQVLRAAMRDFILSNNQLDLMEPRYAGRKRAKEKNEDQG